MLGEHDYLFFGIMKELYRRLHLPSPGYRAKVHKPDKSLHSKLFPSLFLGAALILKKECKQVFLACIVLFLRFRVEGNTDGRSGQIRQILENIFLFSAEVARFVYLPVKLFKIIVLTVPVAELTKTSELVVQATEDSKLAGQVCCVIDNGCTCKLIDILLTLAQSHDNFRLPC